MKISLNTIKFVNEHYGSAGAPAREGVDALVNRIGVQLGAVEEVIPFGEQFAGVLIVKVVQCDKHPNADKLKVCVIDDGGRAEGVTRDENGHVQVVCGAPNVREGLTVAWLPPGSTVPSTYKKEPFVLEARELRGVVSNGMLASAKELGIGDDHSGIMELDTDAAPGTPFVEAYNLVDEAIIDIENKMFTHRPDCFGFLGVAREIEGIHQRPYKSPDWYTLHPEIPAKETDELPFEVENELPELVPRFTAITMRGVTIKPSPVWLRILLTELGVRPINNIVDYSNFFMLETGQPIHVYDYDKVRALSGGEKAVLTVRHPKPGEKISLLNGKTIEPRAEAMMVAAGDHLVCVGGAMGGTDTEVDENTKNIIIEAANWDMYSMRRTAMTHGIFTDAVTRFTKGQSPLQNRAVVAKIVDEIRQYADGKVASELIDDNHVPQEIMERGSIHPPVNTTKDFVNERLGLQLTADDMSKLLQNVEFDVQIQGDELTVKAPFWRTDIEIPEDVVEEVGRLYGYDHLPLDLPKRSIKPAERDELLDLKAKVRDILSDAGGNEVLTYNFVHGDLLDKAGQDRGQAFQLNNALSPDLQYYRMSLLPSLLDRVHPNIKGGIDEFAMFEVNKAHNKTQMNEEKVPREFNNLALVVAAGDKAQALRAGAPYYEARKYLDLLADKLGVQLHYEPMVEERDYVAAKPFAPGRSAVVSLLPSKTILGVVGEFRPEVRRAFKLPAYTAGFEIAIGAPELRETHKPYKPLSKYPVVQQDISLKVSKDTTYQSVLDELQQGLEELTGHTLTATLSPLDIYQKDDAKHLTFRLKVASYQKTLKAAEVNELLDNLAERTKAKLGAERL